MCPSHRVDQNHSGLELHTASSYWDGLNKEGRLNKGNHPGRLWGGNQDGQTQNNHDRYFRPIHNSWNNQQSLVEAHEEQELVIDLRDDVEVVVEDGETIRLRKMVVSKLIKEEMGFWMCKAVDYQSTLPIRVRYHIENLHTPSNPLQRRVDTWGNRSDEYSERKHFEKRC